MGDFLELEPAAAPKPPSAAARAKLVQATLLRQRDEYAAMADKLAAAKDGAALEMRAKAEAKVRELDRELKASSLPTAPPPEPRSRVWKRVPRALEGLKDEAPATLGAASGEGTSILRRYSVTAAATAKRRTDHLEAAADGSYVDAPKPAGGSTIVPPSRKQPRATTKPPADAASILHKYKAVRKKKGENPKATGAEAPTLTFIDGTVM